MNASIFVNEAFSVPEAELDFRAIHAQGPGGQNVNKVASAIQLSFDAANSSALPAAVRRRLLDLNDSRVSDTGVVVIKAQRYRSQLRNRRDAVERLVELLRQAAIEPETRKPARPSVAAREKRLREKRQRSETKSARRDWQRDID